MNRTLDDDIYERAINTLERFQAPEGGFGGGPGQAPHLAPTYAAICALAEVGTERAFKVVNRPKLYEFLLRVKKKDGSFVMNENGEVDIRGSYCALTVATLLNMVTPKLIENVADYISQCQTYQGGIGAEKYAEAHGGLTFCGVATLHMVAEAEEISNLLDVSALLRWATELQCSLEGGFRGRYNKLVDVCYGFWVAALFPMIGAIQDAVRGKEGNTGEGDTQDLLLDRGALQEYILVCAQSEKGGMRDKIGKVSGNEIVFSPQDSPDASQDPDAYHTSQALSGLSVTQHHLIQVPRKDMHQSLDPFQAQLYARASSWQARPRSSTVVVVGDRRSNHVAPTHPIFNITLSKAKTFLQWSYQHPVQ